MSAAFQAGSTWKDHSRMITTRRGFRRRRSIEIFPVSQTAVLSIMKIVYILGILVSASLAAEQPTTPLTPEVPKPTEKVNQAAHIHESSLVSGDKVQHVDGQHADGQPEEGAQEEYRQLEPDEVKALLLKVVDEYVDKDKNGAVTVEELKDWLKTLQESVIHDNVERQWAYYHPDTEEVLSWKAYYPEKKEVVTWERYKNYTYPDEALKPGEATSAELVEMKDMIRRAERRWKNADVDGDGNLSKDEFRDYIHPEESQRAGGVVVLEAMEDMDVDKNDEVSFEEYMNHLQKVSGPEKDDPQWASAQQMHFQDHLDKDKDGSLNKEEMREWIVPSYDRSEAEAWRLLSIADADNNESLSQPELATYYEYFLTLLPPEYWVQEDPTESSKHDEF